MEQFKDQRIRASDWALASLAVLAKLQKVITPDMLRLALNFRFREPVLGTALALVDGVELGAWA